MDPVTYTEIQSMIDCGKLDCLKNCCSALPLIQAVLNNKSQRDLELISKMLCGCDLKGGTTGTPKADKCLGPLKEWIQANRGTFNGLQVLLDAAEGFAPPGAVQLAVAGLNTLLELLEDAAQQENSDTTLENAMEQVCNMAGMVTIVQQWIEGNVPDFLKGLVEAMNQITVPRFLAENCCGKLPAVTGTGGTGNAGGVPPTFNGGSGTGTGTGTIPVGAGGSGDGTGQLPTPPTSGSGTGTGTGTVPYTPPYSYVPGTSGAVVTTGVTTGPASNVPR